MLVQYLVRQHLSFGELHLSLHSRSYLRRYLRPSLQKRTGLGLKILHSRSKPRLQTKSTTPTFAIFKGGQNIEFLCLTDFWRISDALQAFGVASSTAVEYFQMSEFVQYARLSHVLVGNGVPSASTSSDQLGFL